METEIQRKLRIVCLHGFRNSAKILSTLIQQSWPQELLKDLDLSFLDAPYPASGKSGVEGIYDPPYYEWFQANEDYSEYYNFEECLAYLEDYMITNGPFDGLLGFSQGAVLAAALPRMQTDGVALTQIPKIKFVILISGAKFGGSKLGLPNLAANAFSSLIEVPSLHFLGEADITKEDGISLKDSFVDPIVIDHPEGHTIPKLDEKNMEIFRGFIKNIQYLVNG